MIPDTERSENEIPAVEFRLLSTKHKKGWRGYVVPAQIKTACGLTSNIFVTADKVRDLPNAIARYQKSVESRCVFIDKANQMVVQKFKMG